LWTSNSRESIETVPSWNPDATEPGSSIVRALEENAKYNVLTVGIASIIGSLLLILIIDYVPRKQFLTLTFLILAPLFWITGASFFKVVYTPNHAATVVMVALCHFVINLGKPLSFPQAHRHYCQGRANFWSILSTGPNTLTFIIPAELFPTRYRATCHGIAAAFGKLGSIVVQVALSYTKWSDGLTVGDRKSENLGWVFILFGFVMALGGFYSWAWIPSMQHAGRGPHWRIENKNLEELGDGLHAEKEEDPLAEVIGVRAKVSGAALKIVHRFRNP
jgi:MFS transporter, PHS family, inorganic phosphate transporter